MTLRASPSLACPRVSRIRSLTGVRPWLAGRSVVPPARTDASGPCAFSSFCALPWWRMRDAELLACCMAVCSTSAYASRCRFRASGVDGVGMARSSAAAAMSFWLSRGGVLGLSTSKSALMRSRACLPSSLAHSPRAQASPALEARSSHTVRYSSASFASSSRAWASCALMSALSAGEVGGGGEHSAPRPGLVRFPVGDGHLRRQPPRSRCSLGHR
jgi:hypothetical protein